MPPEPTPSNPRNSRKKNNDSNDNPLNATVASPLLPQSNEILVYLYLKL